MRPRAKRNWPGADVRAAAVWFVATVVVSPRTQRSLSGAHVRALAVWVVAGRSRVKRTWPGVTRVADISYTA